jgi:hypothetical protein
MYMSSHNTLSRTTITYVILSMYDVATQTLQYQVVLQVQGLPANWSWNSIDSINASYSINKMDCRLFDHTTLKPTKYYDNARYQSDDTPMTSYHFRTFEYNPDPHYQATFCFPERIKYLCGGNYTNFCFMNGSIHDTEFNTWENYFDIKSSGMFQVTNGNHKYNQTYYAYNTTEVTPSEPYYYMEVTTSPTTPVTSAVKPPAAPAPLPVVPIPRMSMKSLFSNNAQVFYKPHSLSTGSGGVTNSRLKKRKT